MKKEIVELYNNGQSVKSLSKEFGLSEEKVIKILVTADVYSSDVYNRIQAMRKLGKSDADIQAMFNLSKKSFNRYIPYSKGIYNGDAPSENAKRIRKHRKMLTNNKEDV